SVTLLSMGLLQKSPDSFDYRQFQEQYQLIIVDEAHNFRNRSNRQDNLQNILKGNPKAPVLLISATPVNLGPQDLINLVDLFFFGDNIQKFEAEGIKDLFTGLRRISRAGGQNLSPNTLIALKQLQQTLTVKISWRMVSEHFQKDLERIVGRFVAYEEPEIHVEEYSYPTIWKEKIFEKILEFLHLLNYEPAKLWEEDEYREDVNLLFQYKWILYKRCESSLYAFYQSLKNLYDRFRIFQAGILDSEASLENICDDLGVDQRRVTNIIDLDRLSRIRTNYANQDSNIQNQILSHFADDVKRISSILSSIEEILPNQTDIPIFPHDQKLECLIEVLNNYIQNEKPVIVFSEYKDTVDYLYKELNSVFSDKVDRIHGQIGSKEEIVTRFENGEIDIIISSSILAEGINLPRADVVINYDLPYNPIHLIQRAGRALRISNPKKIIIHNFRPAPSIDLELNLYEILEIRTHTILQIFGLDFAFWALEQGVQEDLVELDQVNLQKYLESYREAVARGNPEDLIKLQFPTESIIDRFLTKAIERFRIDEDYLHDIGNKVKKAIVTQLQEDEQLWLGKHQRPLIMRLQEHEVAPTIVFNADNRSIFAGSLAKRIRPSRNRTTITENDKALIDEFKEIIATEISNQEILSIQLSQNLRITKRRLLEIRTRIRKNEPQAIINSLISLLNQDALLPDELRQLEKCIDALESLIESYRMLADISD
ncbi:MAG: helicase-related protein, partial [Candidatus Hermodarchaeota archaeon]